MARIGQCFSTSVDTSGLETADNEMYVEEDILTADKKKCFSDGVGRISKELALEVCKRFFPRYEVNKHL